MKTITLFTLDEEIAVKLATGDQATDLITLAEMLRDEPRFIAFNIEWAEDGDINVSGALRNE